MDDFTLYFVVVPTIIAIGVVVNTIGISVWWIKQIKKSKAEQREFHEWLEKKQRIRREEMEELHELRESNPELFEWQLDRMLERDKHDRYRPTQYNTWTRTWI